MRTDRASVLARIAALYVDKLANPIFEPYGLSLAKYKIIGYLYKQLPGTVTTAELEEYFQMSHSTAVELLNSLDSNGFIKREKRIGSGRSKVIFLTEQAKAVEGQLESAALALERDFTANLTDAEAAEYIRLSKKLLRIEESEENENGKT